MGEQALTPDSLVLIMLRSTEEWNQMVPFVIMTMRHKMELVQERPMANTT